MSRFENTLENTSRAPRNGPGSDTAARNRNHARMEHPFLVTSRNSFSPICEEYKKLKARIMRMTKKEPFKNVLLVTSAVGGEGKSITAANLAFTLSRDYDHSVLLVDADTRRPSLHALLNVTPGLGLSDCLADDVDLGSVLVKVGSGHLHFLPPGKKNDNPVEMFSSLKMEKLVAEMKSRYPDRYVIIDTPPVLLFAETKMISALADGIIFVIREGRAPLEHIMEALDLLKEERLMGVVYNDAGPDGLNGKYPYHTYYNHYRSRK